jgi:hypothetical protein
LMEFFSRINLLVFILKDDNALALIKGKVNYFLVMSNNKHFLYLLQR